MATAISGGTAVSELKLQFECFVKDVLTGPVLQVVLGSNRDFNLTGYVPVNAFTGGKEAGKWMQCTIPLSSVVAESTWQEFLNRGSSEIGLYVTNPTGNENVNVAVYFDNFRIVRK